MGSGISKQESERRWERRIREEQERAAAVHCAGPAAQEELKSASSLVCFEQRDRDIEAELAKMAAEEAAANTAKLFRDAGVPPRQAKPVALIDGDPREAQWEEKLAVCRQHMGKGCLLALVGKRGSGKTQMAAELIRDAARAGRPARYVRTIEFFMAIKSTWRKESATDEAATIQQYVKPALLVLDEAHERGESETENRLLRYLIDCRYGKMRDTVLIANMEPEAFLRDIGSSVASRMEETGGVIRCDWGSFRSLP